MRRTKGEQKAYLDGYEMCADCIEKYLSDEGKQKLNCLLMAVRNAVEVEDIESEEAQPKIGRCKGCKYFEYDSVAKVDGIPLIVAHEICKRWGDGCKTKEDGYCFLFEPQVESEE